MTSDFGDTLRQLRTAQGLSQRDLERRCGWSAPMVHHYESGKQTPREGTVLRLATALRLDRTDADRLMTAAGHSLPDEWQPPRPPDPESEAMRQRWISVRVSGGKVEQWLIASGGYPVWGDRTLIQHHNGVRAEYEVTDTEITRDDVIYTLRFVRQRDDVPMHPAT